MKYEFRSGARIPAGIKSQDVGEELERIRTITGKLKPDEVVKIAAEESSPLHPVFEWDDSAAGKKYRVFQARNLIKAVRVVEVGKADEPAFVAVQTVNENFYQSTKVIVENIDEFQSAISILAQKLAGAQKAVDEVARMAADRGDKTVALIALAAQSLVAANAAISQISVN